MREGLLPSNASVHYPTGLGKQMGKLKWGWEQGWGWWEVLKQGSDSFPSSGLALWPH